jgi:glyoxylase-like metal-dependent hydrolase (beta-lactamase superfamily II)
MKRIINMVDKLEQITSRVWYWPPNPNPFRVEAVIGIVCGDDGTLLVDAGNCPEVATQLKVAMHKRGFPPVTHIVYTHHHWDHVYGACVFDAKIVAHTICKDILLEEAKKPWDLEFLQKEIKKNPKLKVSCNARKRVIKDWDAFEIIPPGIVFKRSKTLNVGNLRVELQHVGGNHAEDSIVVKVPEEGVMFLGD